MNEPFLLKNFLQFSQSKKFYGDLNNAIKICFDNLPIPKFHRNMNKLAKTLNRDNRIELWYGM